MSGTTSKKQRVIKADQLEELERRARKQHARQSNVADQPSDNEPERELPTAFDPRFANLPVVDGQRLEGTKPIHLPADTELHAVGVYEGYEWIDDLHVGSRADVVVDRPGKSVALVLTSYTRTSWHVTVTADTRIVAVFLGGHNPQRVLGDLTDTSVWNVFRTPEDKVNVTKYTGHLPCSHGNSPAFVTALNAMTASSLTTLQDQYSAHARRPFIVDGRHPFVPFEETLPTPVPPNELPNVAFAALERAKRNGGNRILEFTLQGPTGRVLWELPEVVKSIAVSEGRDVVYCLPGDRVIAEPKDGGYWAQSPDSGVIVFERTIRKWLGPGFDVPKPSWAAGIAFDTRRDRTLVSSFGGDGYLYAIASDGRWSVLRSFRNVHEITAMTYDDQNDVFYGLFWGGDSLITLDSGGHETRVVPLHGDIVPGALNHKDTQLICRGGLLIAVNFNVENDSGKYVPRNAIHLISPKDGAVRLASYGWKVP